MPYRDFWTVYPPGIFYLLAGLFRLFGVSMLVERVFYVVVHVLIVALAYRLVSRLATRWAALPASFLVCLWIGAAPLYGSRLYPALLLVLSSCLFLFRYFDDRRWLWTVLASLSVAAASLFRHDFGFYACVSAAIVLSVLGGRDAANNGGTGPGRIVAGAVRECARFGVVVAAALLPIAALLLIKVGPGELYRHLVLFPALLREFRGLPYPPPLPLLENAVYYLPLLYIPSTLRLILVARRDGFSSNWLGTSYLLLVGLGLLSYAGLRPDMGHLTPANLVAVVVLFSSLLTAGRGATALPVLLKWGLAAMTAIALVVVGRVFIGEAKATLGAYGGADYAVMDLDRAQGIRARRSRTESMESAIRHVREHVPADAKIFVGNSRHDAILVNDVLFYFLAERHCASRYHELHPGVATTRRVQERIVEELRQAAVEHAVVVAMAPGREPNRSSESSGVTVLDRYLRANYVRVQQFGPYLVIKHVDSFPPASAPRQEHSAEFP